MRKRWPRLSLVWAVGAVEAVALAGVAVVHVEEETRFLAVVFVSVQDLLHVALRAVSSSAPSCEQEPLAALARSAESAERRVGRLLPWSNSLEK